ncbi:hypothetical protein, partial [Escherichia coli]|uniref:hypothetical protein n=1 Tax=Escherichia coli TaxID=562 RepID=UPI00200F885B
FTNYSRTTWDFGSSLVSLKSSSGSFSLKSTRFNAYINSSSQFTVNSTGNVDLNFVSGTATFSTRNFTYGGSLFTISTQLNVTANATLNPSVDPG